MNRVITLIQEKINCLWDAKDCKISFSQIDKNFLKHLISEMKQKPNPCLCDILTFLVFLYKQEAWENVGKWDICKYDIFVNIRI